MATDKEGKTEGTHALEQLSSGMVGDINKLRGQPYGTFGQDLNAGPGGRTTTALNDLWKGSFADNNLDEATAFGNSMLTGNGLTGGQTRAGSTLRGLGDKFGALSGNYAGQSAAERGYGGLGDRYGDIAESLSGRSAAETGYGSLASKFGDLSKTLGKPSGAQTGFQKLVNRTDDPSWAEGALKTIGQNSRDPSLSESVLLNSALGKEIGEGNPHLKALLDTAAEDTTADFGAAFGSAGRFGGSGHARDLSKSLGDTRTKALYDDFDKSMARQRGDLATIEGQRQQGEDNQYRAITGSDSARLNQIGANAASLQGMDAARLAQLGARTGLMDRQGTAIGAQDAARRGNLADRLGAMDREGTAIGASDKARFDQLAARLGLMDRQGKAATDLFGQEQQGVTNRFGASDRAAGLADASLDAARTRLGVGQIQDANSQAELEAQSDLFNRKRDAPYDRLAKLLGLTTGGIGDAAGVKKETPWWQTLASLGIAGVGALG